MSQQQREQSPDLTRRLLLATLAPGDTLWYRGERLYRPHVRMQKWRAA